MTYYSNTPASGKPVASADICRNSLLRAELIGSDTCAAAGMTVTGNAPTLTLCRELLAARLDPDTALEVYRNGVLSLRIRSIIAGAKLDVNDERFVPYRYRPGPAGRARAAPPIVPNDCPATPMAELAA